MSACATVRCSFSDERDPGAFHSLLKRTSARKFPIFHIPHDDDDDQHSAVPFPRSASPPSTFSTSHSTQLPRSASAPILLSNGKPLKSSLKSSSSSPAMLTAPHLHLRACSEPSTPKNVHFPEKDHALATVRVFNQEARPAALSNPTNRNGDETETEGEDTPSRYFPFAPISPAVNYEIDPTKSSPVPAQFSPCANLLLESLNLSSSSFSSVSPAAKPLLTGFVLVRNLAFEKHVGIRFTLDGWQTVSEVSAHYVHSLSFLPSYISPSLSASTPDDSGSQMAEGWDRFTFTIRLEDYAHSLTARTILLAAHYRINSTYPIPGSTDGEWWDNNGGSNYRVGFRPAGVSVTCTRGRPRRETVSGMYHCSAAYVVHDLMVIFINTAPISSPSNQPQPPMTCKEHVLGLMIPSISNNKEIGSVNETDGHSVPTRGGKLNLCNYVRPTVHAPSSISFPSSGSPPGLSPCSITSPEFPSSTTLRSSSDEDSTSPASSTLSTPSVSPTIAPRLIIGGQPESYPGSSSEKEDEAMRTSKPGHIAGWDWSAPSKPQIDRLGVLDTLSAPGKAVVNNSLYDAFVTQWCFAQGPSLNHNSYGDGGIMA